MFRKKLPRRMYKYFWEVEPKIIDIRKKSLYVIERVLDWGNTKDIKWLMEFYGRDLLEEVVRKRRGLSRKSAVFWAEVLEVNKQEVACLQKPYLGKPFGP